MMRFAHVLCLVSALVPTGAALAETFRVETAFRSVVDPSALTIDGTYGRSINGQSFQQDALLSFLGWQYLAYYDAEGHVCVARRSLPEGEWQVVRLLDYTLRTDDAHNTISLGLAPRDGTLHLAFDHHGHPLHYRVSRTGVATRPGSVDWTPDLFGPVTDRLDSPVRSVTYPCFLTTPTGDLHLFHRQGTSGGGDWWVADYDATRGEWRDSRQIDSGAGSFQDRFNASPQRNAYPNGFDYGPDGRLHYTWTWREKTQGANHDIGYAYSDDLGREWRAGSGSVVRPADGSRVIRIDSPGVVAIPVGRYRSLMNQQAQAVDSRGRIHVAMWHRPTNQKSDGRTWAPDQSRYHHHWRDDGGLWRTNVLPSSVGNRPKLFFDTADNAYLIYTVNRTPARWSQGIYYVNGELQIAAATAANGWTDWTVIHREESASFLNEMLGDTERFRREGILSVLVQDMPGRSREATALRVLDFRIVAPSTAQK
jgi:hypothetical protein